MNYYELTFTYTSPVETSIINDVLAAWEKSVLKVLPKTKTGYKGIFPTNYIM